jgi:predicted RNA-binding protein with PIN domain
MNVPDVALWLVDGFNVLHARLLRGRDRREWWSAERRQLVIDQAARLAARGGRVWVVFDGQRPPGEAETPEDALLRVVFARDADEWLLRAMRAAPDPSRVAVVTGDRPVKDRARRFGAHVVSPRLWLTHCAGDPSSPGPPKRAAARPAPDRR